VLDGHISPNFNDVSAPEQHVSVPLEDLAGQIRTGIRDLKNSLGNALRIALDVGDALVAARERVPPGKWQKWLRENCFLAVRTANLYVELAGRRDDIEAEIDRVGEMSLRAAKRLISRKSEEEIDEETDEKREPAEKEPDATAALVAILDATPPAEITAALATKGLDWFLKTVMPKQWIAQLTAHVARLPRATVTPFLRESEVFRRALSLAAIANRADTKPETVVVNERESLTALSKLSTMLAGEHIDCVVVSVAKPFASMARR